MSRNIVAAVGTLDVDVGVDYMSDLMQGEVGLGIRGVLLGWPLKNMKRTSKNK